MKNYLVCGWLNADDYDAGKAANQCLPIKAKDESEAEDKGEKKFRQKCEVVVATEVD